MKVVVIIPTYNERGNVLPLFAALGQQFAGLDHDMHILVVDDNSPDGTGLLVEQIAQTQPGIHLIKGEKAGLGVAYMRGMTHAMEALGADAVFEMDADFSHDPGDLPRLLRALEEGADFVIGSRYVKGGSIPPEWGTRRKLNSQFGNLVARFLAGIPGVKDCTAGFRAIRTSVLRQVDFSALRVRGYAFQVALLHQAVTLGAVVKEIPVHFTDRTVGESKLGLSDIIEFIMNAWWIRLRSLGTFFKFALVGISGAVVNLAAFSLLLNLGVSKFAASPAAIELSIVTNFLLNNFWTFRGRQAGTGIRTRGLKFNLVSLVSLLVSYGTFLALGALAPRLPSQLDQLIGIAPAMLVNYFFNAYWTFRAEPKATVRAGTHQEDPATVLVKTPSPRRSA